MSMEHLTNEQMQDKIMLIEKHMEYLAIEVAEIKTELTRRQDLHNRFYAAQIEQIKRRESKDPHT